jgi:hypothetical protein
VLIDGAISPSYTLPASAAAIQNDQDAYYVAVTNGFGEAASQHAILSVGGGIAITKQPISVAVGSGSAATFFVSATSAFPLTYRWFQATPGSSTFTAISGATASTYTVASADPSASGSTYYVIVSNGITTSVQSDTVALFVGPLSGVSSCDGWNVIGDATHTGSCGYQLTQALTWQLGAIVWPTLVSTENIKLSFTITTSNASWMPADGFAVVLGDPSLGATLTSLGIAGEGLGARGIPGLVIAFDDFENEAANYQPQDPQVPYIGVGRGETDLWENPYFNVNTAIPSLADPSGAALSHEYVVFINHGYMTVSMDGVNVFSGNVTLPPAAYIYATSSTGDYWEATIISNISAVVSSPSS